MVNYRRRPVAGGTYFFTVTLADRHAATLTTHIEALRAAFRTVRSERPFDVDAVVILPDHLHAIFTLPEADAAFAVRWLRIKSIFTRSLVREGVILPVRDTTGRGLWQRRFWEHAIRDETDFSHHVDYIHFNPVRHGLVEDAVAWPYSSLHRDIRSGVLPPGWGGGRDAGGGEYGERR